MPRQGGERDVNTGMSQGNVSQLVVFEGLGQVLRGNMSLQQLSVMECLVTVCREQRDPHESEGGL